MLKIEGEIGVDFRKKSVIIGKSVYFSLNKKRAMKSKKARQKLYECVLITTINSEIDNIITTVVTAMHSGDGVSTEDFRILHRETWGKRSFAYKIEKNKKGHYSAIYVSADSSVLKFFDKNLRRHQDIIRFLIMSCPAIPTKVPPIAADVVENK